MLFILCYLFMLFRCLYYVIYLCYLYYVIYLCYLDDTHKQITASFLNAPFY